MSPFNIDYPGTPETFVVNASKAIQEQGGVFTGDASKGSFSIKTIAGKVQGNYQIQESQNGKTPILVTITQKPFFVSGSQIQQAIASFF